MNKKEANKKWPKRNGYYFFNVNGKEIKLPSVTNILQTLNKPALVSWGAREAAKIALDDPTLNASEVVSKVYQIRNSAANKGKRIHSLFQAILQQGDDFDMSKVTKEDIPYAQGILDFRNEYEVKHIANEKMVKSFKHGYAGTADEIIKTKNYTWLLDLKTGGVYSEAHLQLECYKVALEEEGIKIDKTMVLRVPGNGTFSLIETKGDLEVFLNLKKVWEWTQLQ